jgi:hypothetical protein
MEPQEYDEMLRTLVRIAAHQDVINQDVRTLLSRQDAHLERLDLAIERIDISIARLETLITRMTQQGENGRDA